MTLKTLRRRAEFLDTARGERWVTPGFVLQAKPDDKRENEIGVGFTASRKVGKAVVRNRAKRRLRALAREILPAHARGGFNLVFVARGKCTEMRYDALKSDLRWALKRLGVAQDGN